MNHHLSLRNLEPQDQRQGGYRIRVTKQNFPALQGMSFYKIVLNPHAAREPHWHANADELGYCVKGSVAVAFFGNYNSHESFIVSEGQVFFIPSGALHSIVNIGNEPAELILQFSHEEPEDFELSAAVGMFSDSVLGNTWNLPGGVFASFKRTPGKPLIIQLPELPPIAPQARYSSPYRFSLEASSPLINNSGGTAKMARKNVWPILSRQALYSLYLTGEGMREPHWHPETAEMGYVAKGSARMSILSPGGDVDTYCLEEGDLYFIPKAYPHHIENLTASGLHILIFFDQPMPQDIGFTASLKSFPDEILSASLGCSQELFDKLPVYYEDLFIVQKTNPLDPIN